jgi:hypothetical protein
MIDHVPFIQDLSETSFIEIRPFYAEYVMIVNKKLSISRMFSSQKWEEGIDAMDKSGDEWDVINQVRTTQAIASY